MGADLEKIIRRSAGPLELLAIWKTLRWAKREGRSVVNQALDILPGSKAKVGAVMLILSGLGGIAHEVYLFLQADGDPSMERFWVGWSTFAMGLTTLGIRMKQDRTQEVLRSDVSENVDKKLAEVFGEQPVMTPKP